MFFVTKNFCASEMKALCCSYMQSVYLKKIGFPQKTCFYWAQNEYWYTILPEIDIKDYQAKYSAYTFEELLIILKKDYNIEISIYELNFDEPLAEQIVRKIVENEIKIS